MGANEPKAVQCTPKDPCTAVQLLINQAMQNKSDIEELESDMKMIRDRLPPWVVGVAWVVGIVVGVLGTLVAKGGV